jgi:hypothetical protein
LPTSGQQVSFPLLKPAAFGRVDNYLTLASDYGDMSVYWHGIEGTVNARLNNGLTLQGGFTSGAGVWDQCEITQALPELYITAGTQFNQQQISACNVSEPWLWTWRGLANYVIPKIDVQVSGIFRSQPNTAPTNNPGSTGASQAANLIVPNAVVQSALGRPLAGNAQNVTLNLALPGQVFPDRLNTVDMRFTKVIRIGRTRSNVGIDLYNLFNANTGTTFNQVFGTVGFANLGAAWQRPTAILNARFVRFNATVDF